MMNNNNSRIEHIDLYRAIGILFMVFLNIGCGNTYRLFVQGFLIPLFFFISGYLLKEDSQITFKRLAKKKFKSLLVPYLVFGLAIALLAVLKRLILNPDLPPFELFWSWAFNDCLSGSTEACMWFLPALFIVNILFFLLRKYLKRDLFLVAAVVVLMIFGVICPILLPVPVPFSIFQSFVGLGFYTVGYFLNHLKEKQVVAKILNLSFGWNTLLCLLVAGLIFLNGETNMRVSEYKMFPLFFITGTFGSIVLFNYCRWILPKIDYSGITTFLLNIGENSIIYLVLVRPYIKLFAPIIRQMYLPKLPEKLFLSALVFILLIVTEKIVHKAKWEPVFGMKYKG